MKRARTQAECPPSMRWTVECRIDLAASRFGVKAGPGAE